MKTLLRILMLTLAVAGTAACLSAQEPADSSIVDYLRRQGVEISQPEGLDGRVSNTESAQAAQSDADKSAGDGSGQGRLKSSIGYRIQVFSDNNPKTAHNAALARKRTIQARFPQWNAYVMYKAPTWRVRVGDFRTQEEAQAALREIRAAIPAYSREASVVRDKINVRSK